MVIKFKTISLRGFKKWKDPVTGKRKQSTKIFSASVNQFNVNSDGVPKTGEEVYSELFKKRKEWEESKGNPPPTTMWGWCETCGAKKRYCKCDTSQEQTKWKCTQGHITISKLKPDLCRKCKETNTDLWLSTFNKA